MDRTDSRGVAPTWGAATGGERAARQFAAAAEAGAAAASARGGGGGPWGFGVRVVRACKLYASQRRSARALPGGADSTTAAAYMLGALSDAEVRALLHSCTPGGARDARCKAVERALKARVRADISRLNAAGPREARADNLAAVRICDAVADMLAAYSARALASDVASLRAAAAEKDATIRALRAQLEEAESRAVKRPRSCYCNARERSRDSLNVVGVSIGTRTPVASFAMMNAVAVSAADPGITGAAAPSAQLFMGASDGFPPVSGIGHCTGLEGMAGTQWSDSSSKPK